MIEKFQIDDRKIFEEKFSHLMPRYYDIKGKKISILEWANLLEDLNFNRHVGLDLINGYRISTVWLGLDHRFRFGIDNDLPPLIFETMIFLNDETKPKEEDTFAYFQERYSTMEEALEGHQLACKMVKEQTKENSIS
jgi:hypothetical protein